MEDGDGILFFLQAELINKLGNRVDRQLFEKIYLVTKVAESSHNTTIYDKELKMHFEDKSALAYTYGIDMNEVQCTMIGQLRKAQDFIRRINYLFDTIRFKMNRNGMNISIENKEEINTIWAELKSNILNDFNGEAVDQYLVKIDKQFESGEIWLSAIQYIHFGLLFPHIPLDHNQVWEKKRNVRFSEFEEEEFEEQIIFQRKENGVRNYQIRGKTLPESSFIINNYSGSIKLFENDFFPEEVAVEIEFYAGSVVNQWHFKLIRY